MSAESYVISRQLLDQVGQYLADRPYREVAPLLDALNRGITPHVPAPSVSRRAKRAPSPSAASDP